MEGPSIYAFAGGRDAFVALAAAHHRRCLEDDVLEHAFSDPGNPQHVERLADYWGEVFGGPARYSESVGGHSAMLDIHAGAEAEADLGDRFLGCFLRAIDDAQLPVDTEFRAALGAYMKWALAEVMSYSPQGSKVPSALAVPSWGWDGLEP